MKLKLNTYMAIKLMVLSVFIFGYTVRVSTIVSLQYVSVLFLFGMCIWMKTNSKKINMQKMLIWFLFFCSTVLSDLINEVSLHQWTLYFLMNTVSLGVLLMDNQKIKIEKSEIEKIIKLYNIFVYLIFLIYIIDLFSGSLVMRILSDNWLICIANWVPKEKSLFTSRYASYLGHYLFTNLVYVGYYILNIFYKQSFEDTTEKNIIVHIIAIIGVISTGSKTGILMLMILLILFNIKRIRYIIALTTGIFILYFAGFFNMLFERLSTEEFSTGRFGAWQTLFDMNVLNIKLFYGIGDDFFDYICQFVDYGTAGIATEFPILCMIFKVGLMGFLAYILLILFIPLFESWKRKDIYSAICIIAFFVLIAAYNGLTAYPDTQILYSFVVLMVLLMSIKKQKYTINKQKVEVE